MASANECSPGVGDSVLVSGRRKDRQKQARRQRKGAERSPERQNETVLYLFTNPALSGRGRVGQAHIALSGGGRSGSAIAFFSFGVAGGGQYRRVIDVYQRHAHSCL
nr:hypothetical protein [Tanacetum cinerariifolium]